MKRTYFIWTIVTLAVLAAPTGCSWRRAQFSGDAELEQYKSVATRIEYPDVESCQVDEIAATEAPRSIAGEIPTQFWDLQLQEAIQTALRNSKVLRDLGGQVVDSPATLPTIYTPAAVESDPRFGVEGALSAFDAAWSTSAFFENNDRALNNQFFGGGTRNLKQDLFNYTSELSKTTAVGSRFAARHNVAYDFNNSPGNNRPNLPWTTNVEAEVRQPLLQGAGVDFNRIAGPRGAPGFYNGVLLARVNTDISLADFELGVQKLVGDVETSYWELYYAYRNLDANIAARDRALQMWRRIHALNVTGRRGGEAEKEAQAREQYFRLEEQVQTALAGNTQEPSRVTTFRGVGGVYNNERRLRLLMGVPITGDRLIRPAVEPEMAKITFSWDESLYEALTRRVELRRQKWLIKRREMETVAARNFLLPRLDAIGRYRWRGIGHDFLDSSGGQAPMDNAVADLLSGDFQEWQMGFELTFPVGFRQAYAAVRNSQLNLARDHAVLHEQERQVTYELSNADAEKDRAYAVAKTAYNRRLAASQQLGALDALYDDADESQKTLLLNLILDAQRRLAEAESGYYRALVEYMLAVKQVHYSKGSLLDYNEVYLTEGPWPGKAYDDAAQRDALRLRAWRLENFILDRPRQVSQGPYPQQTGNDAEGQRPAGLDPNPNSLDASGDQSDPFRDDDAPKIPLVPADTEVRASPSETR